MRQAFDLFQREMLAQHGRMYRTISAYELVEGANDTLCMSFAQLSAHMMVHSRMYSSSSAMYIQAWPALANAPHAPSPEPSHAPSRSPSPSPSALALALAPALALTLALALAISMSVSCPRLG